MLNDRQLPTRTPQDELPPNDTPNNYMNSSDDDLPPIIQHNAPPPTTLNSVKSSHDDLIPTIEPTTTSNTNQNTERSTPKDHDVTNNIILYYQNVRGLGTKSKAVYTSTAANNFDVIALTETWLKQSHSSTEYSARTIWFTDAIDPSQPVTVDLVAASLSPSTGNFQANKYF